MPKMSHPYSGEVVDVADEKAAVYAAQGYAVATDDDPADETTAVSRKSLTTPKKAAKKAAKKS